MRLSVAFGPLFLCFWSALTLPLNVTGSDHLTFSVGSLLSAINWFPVCVSPDKQPAWSGSMESSHCTMTLLNFKHATQQFGEQNYFFYSREYVKDNIEGGWGLPSGIRYGESSGGHTSYGSLRLSRYLKVIALLCCGWPRTSVTMCFLCGLMVISPAVLNYQLKNTTGLIS